MKFFVALFLLLTFIYQTQALECAVGSAEPDAQGHISTPVLFYMPCTTKCIVAFVKTAQKPTGLIAASCTSDDTNVCDGYVFDVNTWGEVKCCTTDRCNAPTGNFPWDGYNWAAPRNPLATTTPSATTDAPSTDAPTTPDTTQAPTPTAGPGPGPTIQCTVGTSVPNPQGGVIRQVTTQSCTQCFAIYTHSSVGPQNVGTISGGCVSSTNRACDFQGTTVTQQNANQWIEVKCCNSGDNCNSQDWGAGQYDWTTPRTSSISGVTAQQPTGTTGSTGGSSGNITTGQPTTTPTTNTPTSQPISGNNNNTLSSTGVYPSSATSLHMSPLFFLVAMMVMPIMIFL